VTSIPNEPHINDHPAMADQEEAPQPPNDVIDAPDSGIGQGYVGPLAITALLILILALMALIVYSLVVLWPAPTSSSISSSASLFAIRLSPNRDQQLFLIVGLAGALGGLIHSARSLYWYTGNRVLRWSWVPMYLSLPIIGSTLAIVFCLIFRGGLLTGETTGAQVNFFGFAAISALVGLFSPEAAEKLKQVFSTLLAPAESGRDRPPNATHPVIHGVEPNIGNPGTMITIYGDNLWQTTAVLFHGARTRPDMVSRTAVMAQVPEGASTGTVRLAVGEQIVTVPGTFNVQT
jgi:hypothetical protein